MKKNLLRFILPGLAVAATFWLLAASPKAYSGSCDDLKFIFARGSGLTMNASQEFLTFKAEVETMLASATKSVRYSIFDLGSDTSIVDAYPAAAIVPGFNDQFFDDLSTVVGAYVSAGEYFEYGQSVDNGVAELLGNIRNTLKTCPSTRFVLSGFSQGAQVVGETLQYLNSAEQNTIVYSALFGDPKLNLPEGAGIFPKACDGQHSVYRVWSPNCYASSGILRARDPYLPDGLLSKTGIWCNAFDAICGGLVNLPFSGHSRYASDGHIRWAVQTVRSRIEKYFSTYQPGRQIWADRYEPIEQEQKQQAALYDVIIMADENYVDQIPNLINLLPIDGSARVAYSRGNPSPDRLNEYLRDFEWRRQAEHAIVILTDQDMDYAQDLVPPGLDIQIFYGNDYTALAEAQFRPLIWSDDFAVCPTGSDCGVLLFDKVVKPNQTVLLAAEAEGVAAPIGHFEWDFDGDKITDLITNEPFTSHTVKDPANIFSYYVTVKAVDKLGRSSSLVWRINIDSLTDETPAPPENIVTNLKFTKTDSTSGVLTWETNLYRHAFSVADSFILQMNGFVLGRVDLSTRQIEIGDLDFSEELSFSLLTSAGSQVSNTAATVSVAAEIRRPPSIFEPSLPTFRVETQMLKAPNCAVRRPEELAKLKK